MKIYEYPKCTTCKKAKKYIEENKGCEIEYINIKENTPTKEELIYILDNFNIEIKKLFNTSGIKYRELNLKDKIKGLTKEEAIKLLLSDGMLIKRPLLIDRENNKVLIGFKEKEWNML